MRIILILSAVIPLILSLIALIGACLYYKKTVKTLETNEVAETKDNINIGEEAGSNKPMPYSDLLFALDKRKLLFDSKKISELEKDMLIEKDSFIEVVKSMEAEQLKVNNKSFYRKKLKAYKMIPSSYYMRKKTIEEKPLISKMKSKKTNKSKMKEENI